MHDHQFWYAPKLHFYCRPLAYAEKKAGFRVLGRYGGRDWDPQLMFSIADDGKWVERSCSSADNQEEIESYGASFSQAIFFHKLWDLRGKAKVTVYHKD